MVSLSSLDYQPYLNEDGQIAEDWQGKIGVYGVFDRDKVLQLVTFSRDIYLGLKQHLVRQGDKCYWVKVQTIERPSKTILAEIQAAWIEENGQIPPGNGAEKMVWNEAIDVRSMMTETEQKAFESSMELEQMKLLKQVCRRVEGDILEKLEARGVKMEFRFNPKMKEQGLLTLK